MVCAYRRWHEACTDARGTNTLACMDDVTQPVDPAMSRAASRRQLLIFVVAVAVYALTLGHGFVFDDGIVIVRNAHIRSLANLPAIFSSTIWAGSGWAAPMFRPLTIATYALNYALTGLAPWSYHLVNVLLHAIVSVLVFRLGRLWRLSIGAAAMGALLFAVHPIHVEAVANVVGRKELLAATFTLAMLLSHPAALRRGGARLALPVVAFAAAMLSKEVGVVGIGLVAIQDWLIPGHGPARKVDRRRLAVVYGGYAIALASFLIARWWVVGGLGAGAISFLDNPAAQASPAVRLMTGTAVIGKGLALLALPLKLSPDYSYRAIPLARSPADFRFVVTILVVAAVVTLAVAKRRTNPAVLVAVTFYSLTLLPGSNMILPIGTIFGERLLYLPSVAFSAMAGLALATVLRNHPGRSVAAVALAGLLLFSVQTLRYSAAWASDLTLFTAAARSAPSSAKVHHKLGEALFNAGRVEEAVASAERSLSISQDNYRTMLLLAEAYRKLGRLDDAERSLRRVLEISPRNPDAFYSLGALRRDAGRLDEAAEFWRRAIASNPQHAASLSDLGTFHYLAGEAGLAREYLERAVRSNPTMASAWYNLGLIYEQRGDERAARLAFEEFVKTAGAEHRAQAARVEQRLQR